MVAPHPAAALPRTERVDYLTVVASMAMVDGVVRAEEVDRLDALCTQFALEPGDAASVAEAAQHPDAVQVRALLERLASSDLRFTLVADLVGMALADDEYAGTEREEVRAVAEILGVADEQIAAIEAWAASARAPSKRSEVAEGLATAGVPLAVVALSGSVWGMGAGTFATGLYASSLSAGMGTGLGVSMGLGMCSYVGMRWLYGRLTS